MVVWCVITLIGFHLVSEITREVLVLWLTLLNFNGFALFFIWSLLEWSNIVVGFFLDSKFFVLFVFERWRYWIIFWFMEFLVVIVAERFTVASYNILADRNAFWHRDMYVNVPYSYMKWGRRRRVICEELIGWNPDIICLQVRNICVCLFSLKLCFWLW